MEEFPTQYLGVRVSPTRPMLLEDKKGDKDADDGGGRRTGCATAER